MCKRVSGKTRRLNPIILIFASLALSSCFSTTASRQTPLPSPSSKPPSSAATSENPEEPIVVFKSIDQLSDVSQTDEAYPALQNLIDRYGIAVAYSDTTFKGSRGLTRYELAMTLASALDQYTRIASLAFAPYTTEDQTKDIEILQQKIVEDLTDVRGQLDHLEANRDFSPSSHQSTRYCSEISDSTRLVSLTTSRYSSGEQSFGENKPVQLNAQVVEAPPTPTPDTNTGTVTSVSQIPDVLPADWAFQALQSLVERYGIGDTLIYSDGTFKGNQALERNEFVNALSAGLERIIELQQYASGDVATKSEVTLLSASLEDMATELKHLQKRLKQLPQNNSSNNSPERLNVIRGQYSFPVNSPVPCLHIPHLLSIGLDVTFLPIAFIQPTQGPETDQQFLLAQVTSASQISDVPNNHWAYEAIRTMVEKFGALSTYPDGTFRGNQPVSRYEFAATLNATLDRISELIAAATADLATREDIQSFKKLSTELAIEISILERRIVYFENPEGSKIQTN